MQECENQYDLLIYAKNGNRPQLLEHLAELYPRHIQIHYGKYKREELFAAARRSRACAYLADDDHGPLALQEILLAGCPTVGVRTGAPFIEHGVTGYFVDRLPPGKDGAKSDQDKACLKHFVDCLTEAQDLMRNQARTNSVSAFSTTSIVDTLLESLEIAAIQAEKTFDRVSI